MKNITPEIAAQVAEHYCGAGVVSDEFTRHLIEAFNRADMRNQYLLSTQYPGLAAALKLVRENENAQTILLSIAGAAKLDAAA